MKRTTVFLAFGGESTEHDVSLSSAKNVYEALDKDTYDVVLCYIDRNGKWWHKDALEGVEGTHGDQLVVVPGSGEVMTVNGDNRFSIDVVFPVLHGKMGEDGTIQGLAAMLHVPVVGCGVEASAVCMNKDATKLLVKTAGVPTAEWLTVRSGDALETLEHDVLALSATGPWFVKPSRAGSSIGVSKVKDVADITAAVQNALQHDDLVLVEPAIEGRELEVAVLGNGASADASGVGEVVPGSEFYDYDDKYSASSSAQTKIDAGLPDALRESIRTHALDAFRALGCSGMARIDFLLDKNDQPYLMEVNTIPGFTDISMYPKLWQNEGLDQTELLDRLIRLALK